MIYTLTFNPSIDYVVNVNQLKLGLVNRSIEEEIYPGGKGINVSRILKNLGIDNIALGFIAGFIGKEIERRVLETGVKADFIDLKENNSRINVKIKGGIETEINGGGPEIKNEYLELLFSKLDRIKENDYLILAGSIPPSLPDNIYQTIMKRLKRKGINFIVDATGKLLVNVLEYEPFLIKPNNHEIEEIFHVKLQGEEDIIFYGNKLKDLGARNVLISLAGDGAILLTESNEVIKSGVPNGKIVNSVGAGDSMVGGFLAGYLKNKSFHEALKLGIASGSATAFSIGLGSKALIEELYANL